MTSSACSSLVIINQMWSLINPVDTSNTLSGLVADNRMIWVSWF